MGTVLTNPFELNFGGLAARNAENITFAADPTDSDGDGTVDTFVQGNTTYQVVPNSRRSMSCNAFTPRDVFIVTKTTPTTTTYEVWAIVTGPRWFTEGSRITDNHGVQNCTGCRRPNYIYNSRVRSGEYTDLQDAEDSRDDYIFEKNVFRTEAGCKDSKALNYSPGASTGNCPCTSAEPVWTQGQNQNNNPQLQSVAERPGDCSCLMPPTNLDGQGYLVEEWEYVGTPFPAEYDPNPPYLQLTDQWKWKRSTSKSELPQPSEDDVLYAIAKPGWKATGLNPPQEFIVKKTLAPQSWDKYRLTTATGFAKIGCLDKTAMNYDSEATIDSQDCKYCTDSDENATIFNQETQKCECLAGYSLQSGVFSTKCKKGVAKSGSNNGNNSKDKEEEEGMSVGTLMAGIAGITVLGLTVLGLSGGKSNE